ncbi:MAG: hypothetical protein ABEJ28_10930 [Salinigranum sp.]
MELLEGVPDRIEARVTATIDRLGDLQAGSRVEADAYFSRPFMRAHTQFDSFAAFCDRSPWTLEDPEDIEDVPGSRRDRYVAATTDFATWEEMQTQAAEEEIVDQLIP